MRERPQRNRRGFFMQDAQEERLKMLCELAGNEHDPDKLIELVRLINELVEAKRNRSTGAETEE